LVVLTSKVSTTLDDEKVVSFESVEIDALIPSKNDFEPCAGIDEVNPYCSSKLFVRSFSIFDKITLFIIMAISYTLVKLR
jgi:hypothetical protein